MIVSVGWQAGMGVRGLSWLILVWLGMLLLGKETIPQHSKANGAVGLGMTRAEALKSPKLYLQMLVIVVISACCGLQQLPSLLGSRGFAAGQVSVMISAMTIFLVAGKLGQGLLYSLIGVEKGGLLTMAVFAAGCLAMLSKALAWPGLILLALGMGIYTTLLPMVVRRVFGSREYASIWSLITTVGCAGTFVGYPLWGAIYDLTGTYTLGLIGAAVLLAGAMWAHALTLKNVI